jgi:hypothetical protein
MAARNLVILDKPEGWPTWIDEIRGSIPDDIYPLIDPDQTSHDKLMQKPSRPRPQEVNPQAANYIDLTAIEKNMFDQVFKHYQVDLKDHGAATREVPAVIFMGTSNGYD